MVVPAPDRLIDYLSHNPLFDAEWYLQRYPDIRIAGIEPEVHFRLQGVSESRNPNAFFDTAWYLATYPDVAAAGINPLDHYYLFGAAAGRDPGPRFDSSWYLESNPDVAAAKTNPLLHFLQIGASERRKALPEEPIEDEPSSLTIGEDVRTGRAGTDRSTSRIVRRRTKANAGASQGGQLEPASVYRGIRRRLSAVSPVMLIIDDKLPRPDEDAGSVAMDNLIDVLQSLGYQILFASVSGAPADATQRLTAKGVIVPTRGRIKDLIMTVGDRIDVALLSRVDCGGMFLNDVRRYCRTAKVIFYPVDLHWLREEREAAIGHDRVAMYAAMAKREFEIHVARMSDAVIVLSRYEEQVLSDVAPGVRVVWAPLLHKAYGTTVPFEKREGIAFIGGFRHRPNVDAVTLFLQDSWPAIRRALPEARFYVIGPDLPSDVAGRSDEGFVAVGHVPDLRPWLDRVRMTVAPLRFGAGAKGKVVTSLAYGVPCVATPIAIEGMMISDKEAIVADPGQPFADAVVRLYADSARWTQMSRAGVDFIENHYSPSSATPYYYELLNAIGAPMTRHID